MTSPIDGLLARARLVHTPYPDLAVEAAEVRMAVRLCLPSAQLPPPPPPQTDPSGDPAAEDLTTLCETIVTHPGALISLRDFLAHALLYPAGARVLGCLLQLAAQEEAARFWWQYAAGAGDPAAAYCLYLHHRTLGEDDEALWWHTQSDAVASPRTDPDAADLATTLRLLRGLKNPEAAVPDSVRAVLDYVSAALTYVDDDLDLPLPDPDFADRVHALTAPAPTVPAPRSATTTPLPARERGATASRTSRSHR